MKSRHTHGGAGRGQGRKPLPENRRKVKHTVWLSPGPSKWLTDTATQEDVKEGVILDELITSVPDER